MKNHLAVEPTTNFLKTVRLLSLLLFLGLPALSVGQEATYDQWLENYNEAVRLLEEEQRPEAEPYLVKAAEIAMNLWTNNEAELLATLKRLAVHYDLMGKMPMALKNYERVSVMLRETGQEDLRMMIRLGQLYMAFNELENATDIFINLAPQVEAEYGKKHPNYRFVRSMLSRVYERTADRDKAIRVQEEILGLFEEEEQQGEEYIKELMFLADLKRDIQQNEAAIALYLQAKSLLTADDRGYPFLLNNLGLTYVAHGSYQKALALLTELVSMTDKTDAYYAERLQNIAFLYTELGDFEKSDAHYQKALGAQLLRNRQDSLAYAKLLNNYGKLFRKKQAYDQALTQFKACLDIFLANSSEEAPDYGYYLNDYALTLFDLGQQEKAIPLFEKNIRISEETQRTESFGYVNQQYFLGLVYLQIEAYEKALPLLLRASKGMKSLVGEQHEDYAYVLQALGKCHVGLNNVAPAITALTASNTILVAQLNGIFKFRSEEEQKAYLRLVQANFDALQAIAFKGGAAYNELIEVNLNNQYLLKGVRLKQQTNVLQQLTELNDPTITGQLQNYRALKQRLTQQLLANKAGDAGKIQQLSERVNTAEVALIKAYHHYFSQDISQVPDWKSLASTLTPEEVVIEFSHFKSANATGKTDIHYVAYVFFNDSNHPQLIPIGKESDLKQVLKKKQPNQLYAVRGGGAVRTSSATALYNFIWRPLETSVAQAARIYYSPTGLLHQISFAGLAKKGKQALVQDYDLVQLSSTSQLAQTKELPALGQVALVGGINYDEVTNDLAQEPATTQIAMHNIEGGVRGTKNRGEEWGFLPGTLTEIQSLRPLFKAKNADVLWFTGKEASESAVKRLSGKSPSILHLATHGFFYENTTLADSLQSIHLAKNRYELSKDPLLRSGLVLAGGNRWWEQGETSAGNEDGILTAMEISNLDLSATALVVLSACETGLGDIDGSEGVYGLQRAFKMAGVDHIIMSLWQVPDVETAEFMELFYGEWLGGKSLRTAFTHAQRSMAKTYKKQPNKWAAFVLME